MVDKAAERAVYLDYNELECAEAFMNGKDFALVLASIRRDLSEQGGVFQRRFGEKTEKEIEELMEVAAIALLAADRHYAHRTELEFSIRERDERA